jgi:hypothetical protein
MSSMGNITTKPLFIYSYAKNAVVARGQANFGPSHYPSITCEKKKTGRHNFKNPGKRSIS